MLRALSRPLGLLALAGGLLLVWLPLAGAQDGVRDAGDPRQRLAALQRYLAGAPYSEQAFEGLLEAAGAAGGLAPLVRAYEEALVADPEDHATRVLLARLQARLGARGEALALLANEALVDGRAALLVARLELGAGRFDAALAALVAGPPPAERDGREDSFRLAARIRLARGTPEDRAAAAAALLEVAALAPDDAPTQVALAAELDEHGLRDAARGLLAGAAERYAGDAERASRVLAERARLERRAGAPDAAIDALRAALAGLARGHWLQRELEGELLDLYRADGRLDEWIDERRAALDTAPRERALRESLASALMAARRPGEASVVLAGAVLDHPGDADLSARLRESLAAAEDTEGLLAEYARVVARGDDDVSLRLAFGEALLDAGRPEAAERQFAELARGPHPRPDLVVRAAGAWTQRDAPDRALALLELGLARDPHEQAYHVQRVRLLHALDRAAPLGDALDTAHSAARGDVDALETVGDLALEVEDGARAAAAYRERARLVDATPRLELKLATAQLLAGEPDGARLSMRRAVERETEAWLVEELLLLYAGSFERPGALRRAESREQGAFEASATTRAPAFFLVALLEEQQRDGEARDVLARHLERQGDDLAARVMLIERLKAARENECALAHHAELDARFPELRRRFVLEHADFALECGAWQDANALLEATLAEAPGSPQLLADLAERFGRIGRTARARELHRRAVGLAPRDTRLRLGLARALIEDGAFAEAEAQLLRCWRDRDEELGASVVVLLSEIWRVAGEQRARVDQFRELALREPHDVATGLLAVELLLRDRRRQPALALLTSLLELRPHEPALLQRRAGLFADVGRAGAALRDWDALRALEGDSALDGPQWLGVLLAGGDDERARQFVLNADDPLAYLSVVEQAEAYDTGVRICEELLARPDPPPGLEARLGELLIRMDDKVGAVAYWRAALAREPDNADLAYRIAGCLLGLGDRQAGLEAAEVLFDLAPEDDRTRVLFRRHGHADQYVRLRCERLLAGPVEPVELRRFVAGADRGIESGRRVLALLRELRRSARGAGALPAGHTRSTWIDELHANEVALLTGSAQLAAEARDDLVTRLAADGGLAERDWVTWITVLLTFDAFPGADAARLDALAAGTESRLVQAALGLAYCAIDDCRRAEPLLARALAHPGRRDVEAQEVREHELRFERHLRALGKTLVRAGVACDAELEERVARASFEERLRHGELESAVPRVRRVARAHARCVARLGRLDEARLLFERAGGRHPDELLDGFTLGMELIAAGMFGEADALFAELARREDALRASVDDLPDSADGAVFGTAPGAVVRLFDPERLRGAWRAAADAYLDAAEERRAYELLRDRALGNDIATYVGRNDVARALEISYGQDLDEALAARDASAIRAMAIVLLELHVARGEWARAHAWLKRAVDTSAPDAELLGLLVPCAELADGAAPALDACERAIRARRDLLTQDAWAEELGWTLRMRLPAAGQRVATWKRLMDETERAGPADASPERLAGVRLALELGDIERAFAHLAVLFEGERDASWTGNLYSTVRGFGWGAHEPRLLGWMHAAAPGSLPIAERHVQLLLADGRWKAAKAIVDGFGAPASAGDHEAAVLREMRRRLRDGQPDGD